MSFQENDNIRQSDSIIAWNRVQYNSSQKVRFYESLGKSYMLKTLLNFGLQDVKFCV